MMRRQMSLRFPSMAFFRVLERGQRAYSSELFPGFNVLPDVDFFTQIFLTNELISILLCALRGP